MITHLRKILCYYSIKQHLPTLTPYPFSQIKKNNFTVNPNGNNDVLFDVNFTYANSKKLFSSQIFNANDTNKYTYPMNFGYYAEVLEKNSPL